VIKALSTDRGDGSRTLLLGLSDENWARLRGGKPIPMRLRDLDPALPDLTVILIGGPDEDSMYEDLRANVRITAVHIRTVTEEPG
jgi:hypothetical protein